VAEKDGRLGKEKVKVKEIPEGVTWIV